MTNPPQSHLNHLLQDVAGNTRIHLREPVDLPQPRTNFRHIVSGSDQGETLSGVAKPDNLYGNGGDTLHGSQGFDTYRKLTG